MFSFSEDTRTSLEVICSIGNKLVRTTSFQNRLVISHNDKKISSLKFVDFERTFGAYSSACAYALTTIVSSEDYLLDVQFTHNDHCIMWLNGKEVYNRLNPPEVGVIHEERSIELGNKLKLSLRKGTNLLLVRLNTSGKDWAFYFQREPDRGAVLTDECPRIELTLEGLDHVDRNVAALSSWLLCGPFGEDDTDFFEMLDGHWGRMYDSELCGKVTWCLPRIELLGDVIDPAPWGTNYNWNYHNGGVAWAMQLLSDISGDMKYARFADDFCSYHLKNIPFIAYQVEKLNAFNCPNHHIYETPLLDFTLAPALPFINALNSKRTLEDQDAYIAFVNKMLQYSKKQTRLPGTMAYTRLTPKKYTTWVDDMFMGIPFLVQAARYTSDKTYLEDAAQQVLDFNKIVWDEDVQLYMHARYSSEPELKLPHWTRANGWGIWATTDVLMSLEKGNVYYKPILKHYRTHVQSLIKYQNDRGFWYNVMDYPESKDEVSGTAIITMAIARGIRNGWLDKKSIFRLFKKLGKLLKLKYIRMVRSTIFVMGLCVRLTWNIIVIGLSIQMILMVYLLYYLQVWKFICWKRHF